MERGGDTRIESSSLHLIRMILAVRCDFSDRFAPDISHKKLRVALEQQVRFAAVETIVEGPESRAGNLLALDSRQKNHWKNNDLG